MTENQPGLASEQPAGEDLARTGDRQIDDAMEQVQQLEELPVADHHDVLSPAHDRLQQALHRDHSQPGDEG